jgi:very-short-patch-repair endonuclease
LFLAFLTDHGLPLPQTNVYLGRYTADCLYADQKLIVELDEHGHQSAWAFEADRERDRHHATIGYATIRVTEASLSARLAAAIRSALDGLKRSLVD